MKLSTLLEENIDITITDLTIPGLLDDNAVEKKPEEVEKKNTY